MKANQEWCWYFLLTVMSPESNYTFMNGSVLCIVTFTIVSRLDSDEGSLVICASLQVTPETCLFVARIIYAKAYQKALHNYEMYYFFKERSFHVWFFLVSLFFLLRLKTAGNLRHLVKFLGRGSKPSAKYLPTQYNTKEENVNIISHNGSRTRRLTLSAFDCAVAVNLTGLFVLAG